MMMPNDPDAIRHLRGPVTVLKDEVRRLPTRHELDRPFDMAIVVPGQGDHCTALPEPGEQLACGRGGGTVVHQVADDDELAGLVFIEQFHQPGFDGGWEIS
jgi:hypothetical protein